LAPSRYPILFSEADRDRKKLSRSGESANGLRAPFDNVRGVAQARNRRGLEQIPYQAAHESFTAMPVATTRLRFTPVSSIRMTPSFW